MVNYTLAGCGEVPLSPCHWNFPSTVTLKYFWTRTCKHNFWSLFCKSHFFVTKLSTNSTEVKFSPRSFVLCSFERSWVVVSPLRIIPFRQHGGTHNNLFYHKLRTGYFIIKQVFWKKQYFQKNCEKPFVGEHDHFKGEGASGDKNQCNLFCRKSGFEYFSFDDFFKKKKTTIFSKITAKNNFRVARPFLKEWGVGGVPPPN